MKRTLLVFLAVAMMACWLQGQAGAAIVTLNTDGHYIIGSPTGHSLDIVELYGINAALAHGTFGLSGNKIIDMSAGVIDPFFDSTWLLAGHEGESNQGVFISVENDTGFTWTDYHLEIPFIHTPVDLFGINVLPNQTLNFGFTLDTVPGTEFSVTQYATSVPLPGALLLVGTGLVGLGALGWRRKISAG